MIRISSKLVLAAVLVTGLSACGGGGNNGGGSNNPPPTGGTPPPTSAPLPPQTIQERFGSIFASIFNADRNSEPRDPTERDIVAVNLTADPIDF